MYFDRFLLQQAERRRFIDGKHVLSHTGKVLVVVGPFKDWQGLRLVGVEGSFLQTGQYVPDDDGLGFVQSSRVRQWTERYEVLFARGEVDKLDARMAEADDLLELFSAPQRNTFGVESGQIGTERGPSHQSFRPSLKRKDKNIEMAPNLGYKVCYIAYRSLFQQRWFGLGVEINSDLVALIVDHRELVTSIGVKEVVLKTALLLEWLRCRILPLGQHIIILFKVGQKIDREGVVLVKLVTAGSLDHFQGFRST